MIAQDDMMNVLTAACPSFAPHGRELQVEWKDEAHNPPVYLGLADFARVLIGMLERGETSGFPSVFAAVERLHVDGDHFVQEAATIGLLESLQNLNLHDKNTNPEQFRPYLGPVSERYWGKLHRFWEKGELIIDD